MIEVFFATNRNLVGTRAKPDFGHRFNAAGPAFFRVGRALVERTEASSYELHRVEVEPERPGRGPDDAGARLGSTRVFAEVRERAIRENRDVVVLLHGYASSFSRNMERGAEIKEKYLVRGREPELFVFSWPSDGEQVPFRAYFSDRCDAMMSGVAMARALKKLLDFIRG